MQKLRIYSSQQREVNFAENEWLLKDLPQIEWVLPKQKTSINCDFFLATQMLLFESPICPDFMLPTCTSGRGRPFIAEITEELVSYSLRIFANTPRYVAFRRLNYDTEISIWDGWKELIDSCVQIHKMTSTSFPVFAIDSLSHPFLFQKENNMFVADLCVFLLALQEAYSDFYGI